jgi:hypothetical protein
MPWQNLTLFHGHTENMGSVKQYFMHSIKLSIISP